MRLLAGIVLMAAEMAVTAMVVVAPAPALVLMFNVSHAAAQIRIDANRRRWQLLRRRPNTVLTG